MLELNDHLVFKFLKCFPGTDDCQVEIFFTHVRQVVTHHTDDDGPIMFSVYACFSQVMMNMLSHKRFVVLAEHETLSSQWLLLKHAFFASFCEQWSVRGT